MMAIEMARTEQANGENPDAVALAKKIEKDRKAERQDAGHAQSLPSGSSAGPHRDHLSRQADGVTAPGAGPPVNVLAWPGDHVVRGAWNRSGGGPEDGDTRRCGTGGHRGHGSAPGINGLVTAPDMSRRCRPLDADVFGETSTPSETLSAAIHVARSVNYSPCSRGSP